MGITVQQPGLAQLYGGAAISAAEKKRARELEQQAIRRQEQQARKEEIQASFQYKAAMRQQDMAIDLQMSERAKMWEIEKMELRSRMDFQREEQQRQRKLDSLDSAIQQIDKEVLAGRMTEQEAYPIKQKLEINKTGVSVPVSAFAGDDGQFGVDPYWMRWREAPEGTPERQLYETKMQEQISGQRMGTRPYYFDPAFMRDYPEAARQSQEARGIFLSDEEFGSLMEAPMDTKQLDVGVRAMAEPMEGDRVRVISPEGEPGSILRSEIPERRAEGFEILDDTLEEEPELTPEDASRTARERAEGFYKPSWGTFFTMSPLRHLMERSRAKKILRKTR